MDDVFFWLAYAAGVLPIQLEQISVCIAGTYLAVYILFLVSSLFWAEADTHYF